MSKTKVKAKPLLKWVGGKRQLLKQFEDIFPKDFNIYHEPMVGGGAVFFDLSPQKAVINDVNKDLMRIYKVVRDNVDDLIKLLKDFKEKHRKKFYYKRRKEFNKLKKDASRENKLRLAAIFIYMNRTCFNGLYRVNKKGEFNVPIGSYKNPTICDEENLRAVSKILKNVKILCKNFQNAVELVKENDFIYFDPPYDPISDTSNFTEYTNGGFGKKEQKQLAQTFKGLDQKGAKVMLSNSGTDFIMDLYKDFNIHKVKAKRYINCKGSKRGDVSEIVVTNY